MVSLPESTEHRRRDPHDKTTDVEWVADQRVRARSIESRGQLTVSVAAGGVDGNTTGDPSASGQSDQAHPKAEEVPCQVGARCQIQLGAEVYPDQEGGKQWHRNVPAPSEQPSPLVLESIRNDIGELVCRGTLRVLILHRGLGVSFADEE